MPTPIAIAVVEREGRFLIGQRPPGVPLAGLWEFPGGKLHPGETPEAAAVRECLEETGFAVEPVFRYPDHIEQYEHGAVQLFFIACRGAGASPTEVQPPFRWVRRQELTDFEFPQGNRSLLDLLTTGATRSSEV